MTIQRMTEAEKREYDQKHFEEWGTTHFYPPLNGAAINRIFKYQKCEILGLVEKRNTTMVRVRILPGSRGGNTQLFRDLNFSQYQEEHYVSEGDVFFCDVFVNGKKLTREIYEQLMEGENAEAEA